MATVAAPDVENPITSTDVNSETPTGEDASTTPPSAVPDGGSGSESNDKPADVSVYARDDDGGGAVTDIPKKMKRAERFGMAAQLSEEDKRNSRAERFRTATAVNGSDSSKPSEELKKKARAERFGIVQSEPNDGEAKKKARLARFGSSKLDPVEEEKKKARAIRFSQPAYGLNASGKGDIEFQKTASTGKADEETK